MAFSQQWLDVLEQIIKFKNNASYGAIFRGHQKDTYQLVSGLFRDFSITNEESMDMVLKIESSLYVNFQNKSRVHTDAIGFELLEMMQHHGVPTRLLDWTHSFPMALYFATHHWKNNNPTENAYIWMLDPIRLNEILHQKDTIITLVTTQYDQLIYKNQLNQLKSNSLAISPRHNDPRIIAQQSMFTIQGNNFGIPLDKEIISSVGPTEASKIIHKLTIPYDLHEEIKKFIEIMGIGSQYDVFPDLDHLAQDGKELMFQMATKIGIKPRI